MAAALRAADAPLVQAFRSGLAARADAAKAPAMQAYMKSSLPFYGVAAPARDKLFRDVVSGTALPSFAAWHDTALMLWREASRREELYAAISLIRGNQYKQHAASLDALPLYEGLIRTGAWWDVGAYKRVSQRKPAHASCAIS